VRYGASMDEAKARARIEELEQETHRLRADEAAAVSSPDKEVVRSDAERLKAIHVELDQLWDYLRQRQALADAGQNPDEARVRGAGTVEGYLG
jgi:Protein of unknown function (DUF2630)